MRNSQLILRLYVLFRGYIDFVELYLKFVGIWICIIWEKFGIIRHICPISGCECTITKSLNVPCLYLLRKIVTIKVITSIIEVKKITILWSHWLACEVVNHICYIITLSTIILREIIDNIRYSPYSDTRTTSN